MNGYSYRSCLVGDGSCDGLSYPPCCVSREFVAFVAVEFFNGFYKTEVTFLDKVEEEQSPADISFCYAYNKTQVRFVQYSFRFLVALRYARRKFGFLLGGQKGNSAYLVQIYFNGVVNRYTLGLKQRFHIVRVGRKNAYLFFKFFEFGVYRKIFLKFDILGVKLVVNYRFLIFREFKFVKQRVDFVIRKRSFFFALFHQLFECLFLFVYRILLFVVFLFRHYSFPPCNSFNLIANVSSESKDL